MAEEKNINNKAYKPGDVYQVPPKGSLGLLALGYRGLEAWREAQKKAETENTNAGLNKPNDSAES